MAQMSYDEAVSFIHGRRKFTKDPSLVKMRRMAELMGNPQKKLKLIHVTGTNGKGSVTAYLRELLMSHGYRVGTFTSPFIVRFNERVAINGEMIPDNELVEEVERIKPVIERIDDEFDNDGPKEFEVLTAIMLDYFVKMVEYCRKYYENLYKKYCNINMAKYFMQLVVLIPLSCSKARRKRDR